MVAKISAPTSEDHRPRSTTDVRPSRKGEVVSSVLTGGKARAFFFVCAGILMLALSYHVGARSAIAQAPANPVVGIAAWNGAVYVATSNGDTYILAGVPWASLGNVFGGPTPVERPSLGQLKTRWR